jgi:hypothetical protein
LEIDNGLLFNKILVVVKRRISIIHKENKSVKYFFKKVDFLFRSPAMAYERRCFKAKKGIDFSKDAKQKTLRKRGCMGIKEAQFSLAAAQTWLDHFIVPASAQKLATNLILDDPRLQFHHNALFEELGEKIT